MRVGLIGAGRIGMVHAASLAADPRVEELAVVDANSVRAGLVAAQHDAHTLGGVDELLRWAPDAVVIATPTPTHADLLVRCCELNVPVFCEKPGFLDLVTARRVVEHVRGSGVAVHIGFQRRFDDGYRCGYEAIRSGSLGSVRRMHLVTADPAPPPADYVAGSGGIHRDCQIHDFDILRWVSGREVVEVFATGANRGATYFAMAGDVDETAAILTMDDGSLATVQASRYNGAGYDVRMEVAGTEATLVVGLDTRVPLRSSEPDAPTLAPSAWSGFLDRFDRAYRAEMAAFVSMVAEAAPSPCTVDDALRALLIAEATDLSRRVRRPVSLDEISAGLRPVERSVR